MNRTIRSRLLAFGLLGLGSTLLAIAIGLFGNQTIGKSHQETVRLASMVRQVMLADMMHDAIRADALNSVLKAGAPELAKVHADAQEHLGIFRASIDSVKTMEDPAVKAQLAKTLPALDRYAKALESIIKAAEGGAPSAEASLPEFLKDFEMLETEMGLLDELVEKAATGGEVMTEQTIQHARIYEIVTGIFAAVALFWMALRITGSISDPITAVVSALEEMAKGNLTVRVPPAPILELDRMAVALNQALENQAGSLVALGMVAKATTSTSALLDGLAGDLSRGSDDMAAQCGLAAESTQNLTRVMEKAHQSANHSSREIGAVAAAVEEMSATAGEIARGAEQTRQATRQTVAAAVDAENRVGEMSDASREISRVVDVIMEIADKTKLLALNATIEAARAGEAGKGFAVVAGEVKELARSTSVATEDIRHRIEVIQSSTAEAVGRITGIRTSIAASEAAIGNIAAAVEQQSATTAEISRSLARAAEGIKEASEAVSGASESARTIAANGASLSDESLRIKAASEKLGRAGAGLIAHSVELESQVGRFRVA